MKKIKEHMQTDRNIESLKSYAKRFCNKWKKDPSLKDADLLEILDEKVVDIKKEQNE